MSKLSMKPLPAPVQVAISIPGSKSYTNRALVLAALSKDKVTIRNPLFSDDTEAMMDCLRSLNFLITKTENEITMTSQAVDNKEYTLYARDSGTTIRFILALSTVLPGIKTLGGSEGLNNRPIRELVDGLRQLGASIEYAVKDGQPPLKISSSSLRPGVTKLNGDISSQYFSAIMMIAPVIGEIIIEVAGNQISKSYIDMTIDLMGQFGVKIINEDYKRYIIRGGQQYNRTEYTVEGDFSGAGYFFAIAAVTKSTLTLKNLNPHSKQGDSHFVKLLERMGSKITNGTDSMTISGAGVKPMDVDMELCPDQAQTLAVLAAFADGVTTIKGIRSLRVKETERVQAVQNELRNMGIKTESTNDTLTIYGGKPHAAEIDTYGDHRMAMSFAVAGTKLNGLTIKNPEVVKKTFPSFWSVIKTLGVELEHE